MAQVVLVSLGIVIVAALIVRRLLSIGRGQWTMTMCAVIAGEAAAIGTLQVVTGRATTLPWTWVPLGLALVACYSMIAVVLLQLLAPSGVRRRLAPALRPVSGARRLVARYARYAQVIRIVIRKVCVPITGATWAGAPRLAVGSVPRLVPGGPVPAWPGMR
jgi:hypothetical protein